MKTPATKAFMHIIQLQKEYISYYNLRLDMMCVRACPLAPDQTLKRLACHTGCSCMYAILMQIRSPWLAASQSSCKLSSSQALNAGSEMSETSTSAKYCGGIARRYTAYQSWVSFCQSSTGISDIDCNIIPIYNLTSQVGFLRIKLVTRRTVVLEA